MVKDEMFLQGFYQAWEAWVMEKINGFLLIIAFTIS
jgi:hypothetical protein